MEKCPLNALGLDHNCEDHEGPAQDQMSEAVKNQFTHVASSLKVDRRGWTEDQWIEDAKRLMNDLEGSVLSLVNGHVSHMIERLNRLETVKLDEPTPLEMTRELRETLGMYSGAMPISTKQAWKRAIEEVEHLVAFVKHYENQGRYGPEDAEDDRTGLPGW